MRAGVAVWPAHEGGADPFRDPWWDESAAGRKLRPVADPEAADAFLALLERVESGLAGAAEIEGAARRLGVWGPVRRDGRTVPVVADRVPAEHEVVRMGTDLNPALGNEAPELVLGPWAATLDPGAPHHRRATRMAMAHCTYGALDGAQLSPFVVWCRRRPPPPLPERLAFRAIAHAPVGLYRLRQVGERYELHDLLGLGGSWSGVVMTDPGWVDVPGEVCVARVVRSAAGPVAVMGLLLPKAPPTPLLRTWLHLDLLRSRVHHRGITLDVVLRKRGHVLVRRVHEWWWHHAH